MEDTSDVIEPRAKRQKKDKTKKSAAFDKLKQLKGSKHKYEVDQIDNVYEVIDEREYTKQVLHRQDDDWIVDDDGSGYVEDGRDIFDDDLDPESIAAAKYAQDSKSKKKRKTVSDNSRKGNLQYLISNMSSKKTEDTTLGEDEVLSDLLTELDSTNGSTAFNISKPVVKPKPMASFNLSAEKRAAKDYIKRFSLPKLKPTPLPIKSPEKNTDDKEYLGKEPSKTLFKNFQNKIENNKLANESNIRVEASKENEIIAADEVMEVENVEIVAKDQSNKECVFDDDLDMSGIMDILPNDMTDNKPIENITEEQLLSGWETMQETSINDKLMFDLDTLQLPMVSNEDGSKVFRFFWWDAYENVKRPGIIYLFGKTYCESAKSYISCCIRIQDIERVIYLLPRPFKLAEGDQTTDQQVSLIDVYQEFNTNCAPVLALKSFKSRKVTKNYCFDPEIPVESDYLEVRYSAKHFRLDSSICKFGGKTFSKVFGSRSSFLEIFLLDRKIKGPCWLDLSNPELSLNPVSYCKLEIFCNKPTDISINRNISVPPPPLTVATINMRAAVNPKNMTNEIIMLSVLVNTKYAVDKKPPNPPFQQHFCIFTKPGDQVLPFDIHDALTRFKATKVQKMDSERALLNFFISQFSKIDADVIVGHDFVDYQIGLLCERLVQCRATNFCRLGKVKRSDIPIKRILEKELFVGRLVCDIKVLARELIRSRSYDLDTLCQTILKLKEGERSEIDPEDIPKYYDSSSDLLRLVSFTMKDAAYILKMMYELNVIPLALQITTIAGNVMSKTLLGGRSERNEFLLLHAFSEKNYIVPEKPYKDDIGGDSKKNVTRTVSTRNKKPAYSGGLVLDPKVGFYDKLILLMDFNSLYPSIIQEYNICFTTIPDAENEDEIALPDRSLPPGILPTEIRKLVESRREVKKLMNNPDISSDLRMQYNIRQMALKLTANSMYGCLGFSHSRFYAKNLAALVTYKGREILTNTNDLVQKMNYDVIYGDTDSIMINTNCLEYDEVMKIGIKIKQEINKLYKQVELDIDGVFKYLLLLKKKKYAAVTLSKDRNGELQTHQEHKGLDIVRRDWSQLAAAAGRFTLDNILNDQSTEDRITNIHDHLMKLKDDLYENKVPLSLLVITKQLNKDPHLYPDKNQLPHVQVALRYNKKGGRILRAGDTVPYVICDDNTNAPAMQRAYHIEELKNSDTLKIDFKYYLTHQIHPVVSRLCEPLEGTDAYQIANCLGLDGTAFKKASKTNTDTVGQSIIKKEDRFHNCEPFTFICFDCKSENKVTGALMEKKPFLTKCVNRDCNTIPITYLPSIQNQLTLKMRSFISKYYSNQLTCEDPACPNETVRLPLRFVGNYPVCTLCKQGVMYKKYSEGDLYNQLFYFQYIFDLSKLENRPLLDTNIENAYNCLKTTVEKILKHSKYSVINLKQLHSVFLRRHNVDNLQKEVSETTDLVSVREFAYQEQFD